MVVNVSVKHGVHVRFVVGELIWRVYVLDGNSLH
jgi:hypothetical protein